MDLTIAKPDRHALWDGGKAANGRAWKRRRLYAASIVPILAQGNR